MLFKYHDKSSPPNSTQYAMLYPQNGDRIVAIDSVTSFHPVYRSTLYDFSLSALPNFLLLQSLQQQHDARLTAFDPGQPG